MRLPHQWMEGKWEGPPRDCAEANYKPINWYDHNYQQARTAQLKREATTIGPTRCWTSSHKFRSHRELHHRLGCRIGNFPTINDGAIVWEESQIYRNTRNQQEISRK